MKNGILIWNVILSLVAGLLLYLQFGPKKNKTDTSKPVAVDTSVSKQFRIAYFEMDSVEANFNLVKDVNAEISAKETEYLNNKNQLDDAYMRKFKEFSARESTMNAEEKESAQNTLSELSEKIKVQKQDLEQDYNQFVMMKQVDLKKKIKDYLKEFNKTRNFSYIISYEEGLFYFKDTAYNITAEVIKGLNEYCKPGKNK